MNNKKFKILVKYIAVPAASLSANYVIQVVEPIRSTTGLADINIPLTHIGSVNQFEGAMIQHIKDWLYPQEFEDGDIVIEESKGLI